MSTTDTRASFDKWDAESKGHHFNPDRDWIVWQAATEAAKATGTAGEQTKQSFENIEELPPLPECAYVQRGPFASRDLFTVAQMREYGQACAAMARGAAVRGYIENGAEAARQPAPVVAVKTWQESAAAHLPELREVINSAPFADVRASYMATEIADLRAALAATNRSQP